LWVFGATALWTNSSDDFLYLFKDTPMRKFAVVGLTLLSLSVIGCSKSEDATAPAPAEEVAAPAPAAEAPAAAPMESIDGAAAPADAAAPAAPAPAAN
jgi:hypothetical protein